MTKPSPGKFITIEGIEGVGKSTAIDFIHNHLNQNNIAHRLTREPGGTQIAEAIRAILLQNHVEPMADATELLLMFAARAQHLAQVIKPSLAAGEWVICDRFTDASYAYQGGGRGLPVRKIEALESWVQEGLQPDCTILLDAPADLALGRAKKRSAPDRIESETLAFFQKVRTTYLERAKLYAERYVVIDAAQPLADVQLAIQAVLEQQREQQHA